MTYDRSGHSVVVIVGEPLALPWSFADDDLGACRDCGGLLRYRARAPAGVLVCPLCLGAGARPGDVWIVSGDTQQGGL